MSKTSLFNNNLNFFTNEQIYSKFLNVLMKSGKKHIAESTLRKCCFFIKIKQGTPLSLNFVCTALQNVKPLIELKSQQSAFRKKLMKPVPISSNRSYKLAIDWIIEGAKKRREHSMALRLYYELVNAYNNKGYAINKRNTLYKECKLTRFSKNI